MIKIGQNCLANTKGEAAIENVIKTGAIDTLPSGEELVSALLKDETMTIAEWVDFMSPPDILLEKELCWPIEPELTY